MVDLFTADFNGLENDARYSAIADFARAQPVESNRHDFKTIWNNDTLKDVAAFANTFGGILIIGAKKGQSDMEVGLIGVTSVSELTTGIASAIATNISPTPSYDIMECNKPGDMNTRYCVIRVRSQTTLHLITKKDIPTPVWIRNADQTIRADAAQLRMMIDRERRSGTEAPDSLVARAHHIFESMTVNQKYGADLSTWPLGTWFAEENYFKLALIPKETKIAILDVGSENKFVALIHDNYRRIRSCLSVPSRTAADAVNRSDDFHEYRWYHKNLDYEGRWRITDSLEVIHATQVRHDTEWSLVDVVFYTILLLRIGAKWWESLNYFGDGILVAKLNVRGLHLSHGNSGQYVKLFGPGDGDAGMREDVLEEHPQQRDQAEARVTVNFGTMRNDVPVLVTSLMNSLLRGLGHGVLWAKFEENVRILTTDGIK